MDNYIKLTINKCFLINQFSILDIDVKLIIKQLVKIRIFKIPTVDELYHHMEYQGDKLYLITNDYFYIYTFHSYFINFKKDITSSTYKNIYIGYTITSDSIVISYNNHFFYVHMLKSYIKSTDYLLTTTPKLHYLTHGTEFTPDTIFYIN